MQWYLLNPVVVGGIQQWPGRFIDDTLSPTAAITGQGGVLWPASDAFVSAAASAINTKYRKQGKDVEYCTAKMYAAVAASIGAGGAFSSATPFSAIAATFTNQLLNNMPVGKPGNLGLCQFIVGQVPFASGESLVLTPYRVTGGVSHALLSGAKTINSTNGTIGAVIDASSLIVAAQAALLAGDELRLTGVYTAPGDGSSFCNLLALFGWS